MAVEIQDVDVLISGGGLAGLIAAAGFGAMGYTTLCVDPARPASTEAGAGADLRSTAFLMPSIKLLDRIGVWDRLAPFAGRLQIMRIIDAGGSEPVPRLTRDFDAAELGDQPFGWNLPNWLLRRELENRLKSLQCVRLEYGISTASMALRDADARVTLSDGRLIRAKLLIAADGRNSPTRQALGIGVRVLRYGQKAMAFAVTHPQPHGNVSTETHRSGGPFTLVPLPDRDGKPSSAVVWMDDARNVARLVALPREDFGHELNARSAGILGQLEQVTPISCWPIISQIADRFSGKRTALIAEAAHVLPPIGAQGLNMSLADLEALLELSTSDPGNAEALARYDKARRPDATARLIAIHALNRTSQISLPPLRDLRAAALTGISALPPFRRLLMRAGLGEF